MLRERRKTKLNYRLFINYSLLCRLILKLVTTKFSLIYFVRVELDSGILFFILWLRNVLQVDPESHDPVVHDNGVSYLFIQHNNVYLMTASRQNCNAASLLFFLHRIVDVSSFGNNKLHSSFVVVLFLPA